MHTFICHPLCAVLSHPASAVVILYLLKHQPGQEIFSKDSLLLSVRLVESKLQWMRRDEIYTLHITCGWGNHILP